MLTPCILPQVLKLTEFADIEDCLLKVDEAVLEATLKAGDAEARIAPIEIKDDRRITPYSPYQHSMFQLPSSFAQFLSHSLLPLLNNFPFLSTVYLEFSRKQSMALYYRPEGEDSPFTKSVRLKLIYDILRASKRAKGCNLEITRMLFNDHILTLFPLHDRSITKQLASKCTTVCSMPWDVPTHDLKEYFGEKIALYTVFIGHYSVYLIVPSIVGLAFQLVVWGTGNFSHPVLPFYSLLITGWSIYMLEYWKRQEATTALHWGMSSFEKKEQERPEFEGKFTKSHINGEDMVYYPWRKSVQLQYFSRSIIIVFVVTVMSVVGGIYVLRFSLEE